MLSSYITLIHKEGKDPSKCGSYRPIALLNSDLKLFTKILANRLGNMMPKLINPDQVGFIQGRQARDNTRRAIDLIEVINKQHAPALIMSLDAEKAFDRLNWEYMLKLLQGIGLQGPFLTAIQQLYSTPTATLKLPGATASIISIRNGTRQGCPLSPLLYALSIEPLATAIRNHPDITGPKIKEQEYVISLFADDVLLTLTNPAISLPNLHNLLATYSRISGYKLNIDKTEVLPLNMPKEMKNWLSEKFHYKWKERSLKYLGIHLTNTYKKLYQHNYPPLIQSIKSLLNKWKSQSISWLGRITTVKMSILPKLLFLFETLPISVPKTVLQDIQRSIFQFVWGKSSHRIAKTVMMASKRQGGLAAPNILKYYEATHLRQILGWTTLHTRTRWAQIESLWMEPIHPSVYIWDVSNQHKAQPEALSAVKFTLHIWQCCKNKYRLISQKPLLTPILANPSFPPGMSIMFQTHWKQKALFTVQDFLNPLTNKPLTFETICQKYQTPHTLFYEHIQITHFIQPFISKHIQRPSLTRFEILCRQGLPREA
uniref:Reverse transcriptase domain-containing protein n=1 Tax=Xenopus tropicalis TaxID=8364 RepID=A0A803KCY8_XENTR